MPPEPRSAARAPAGAVVNAMVLRLGQKAADTDGDGDPDLIPVEAYLFAQPHPSPLFAEGAFEFALFPPGVPAGEVEPMVRWQLEPAAVQDSRMVSPIFGPGYGFRLSLLDHGGDDYPLMYASLTCTFRPAKESAQAVRSGGVYSIQIGQRR